MKKIFNITLVLLLSMVAVVSCKKESLLYDGPVLAHFLKASDVFFVDSEDSTYTLQIGLTKALDRDLTVKLVADEASTAVEGEQYALESYEVIIPAGEVIGNVTIVGLFSGITDPVNLKLKLVEGENVAGFSTDIDITIRQFCPFVRDEFVGIYNVWSELNEDDAGEIAEYEVEAIADPDNENGLIFLDVFEDGKNIKVTLDASNKSNFVAVLEQAQTIFTYSEGYPGVLAAGKGTFNACEPEIQFRVKVDVPGLGTFGDITTILTKVD